MLRSEETERPNPSPTEDCEDTRLSFMEPGKKVTLALIVHMLEE